MRNPRDPWFPIALMLIVLITIWLGIFGPMPEGLVAWVQKWQTLIAAFVASVAAFIAFQNTTRSLNLTRKQETNRRSRKHAAVRAVLPLALSQVSEYAMRSAHALNNLVKQCAGKILPTSTAQPSLVQPLPSDTLQTFAEFIEFSDAPLNVQILESTIAWVQIHDARLRSIVTENNDPESVRSILRIELEARIIDAAAIYAGAGAYYNYSRRQVAQLPNDLLWDDVLKSLRNMGFDDDEYPNLYSIVAEHMKRSKGPFERLRPNAGH